MGKIELKVLREHERAVYDRFLSERFGFDTKELRKNYEWVPLEHHLYLVSHSLTELAPPPGFSLSLPVLKTYGDDRLSADQDMKLSHEGAVALGLTANMNRVEITKEQLEAAMKNQPVVFEGLEEGMYIASYTPTEAALHFPIGLLKIGSKRTELLIPKMA